MYIKETKIVSSKLTIFDKKTIEQTLSVFYKYWTKYNIFTNCLSGKSITNDIRIMMHV